MTPKVGMTSYGLMMFLSVLPTVKKIQREFDYDIIDAQFVYPDGFAGVLLGRYFGKPVVVTSHGTDINLYPKFPLIRHLLRYTLRKADKVIAVCQSLKDVMIQLGISGEKVSVIPNGVDLAKFYPSPKEEARTKLGIPNRKVIISVGGLIPRKGFDLLIKAFKILVEDFQERNIYMVIVGEGPSREELEKLVSSLGLGEYVRLVGAVPHKELYLWFSAADLFCLASSREGWPCVLLESLACGTPVVATDVWGTPEVITSDAIGLLTKRSERDIAEKISLALAKPWHHGEIIEYAREHTWDRAALSVFEVFKSVLNGLFPNHAICRKAATNTSIRKSQAGSP
jgi:glycosyltransferase involved in cell wall biosynthesis